MSSRSAEDIVRRFQDCQGRRGNFESLWRDAATWILTRKMPIGGQVSAGADRDIQVFDSTALRACEKLAAGLFGYMCPPNEVWFRLRSIHREVMEDELACHWYDEVSSIIREALYVSNFVQEIHEVFMDLGAFCTANLHLQEGMQTPLNFKCIHINEYYVEENAEGVIDTVYRKFTMTVRQIVQEFGTDVLSGQIRRDYEAAGGAGLAKEYEILHAVMPRADADLMKLDSTRMPFASIYINIADRSVLRESGYFDNPYMVCRFSKAPGEAYGRGPGMTVMPEIKLLNKIKKTVLMAGEKAVDPPILVPDDGVIGPFRTTPGAINYWRANAFQNKPEAWDFKSNVQLGVELMNQERMEIERGFYVDLFEQLARRKAEMTATEVVERVREKLVVIAPAIGRLQQELFSPVIHRSFRILNGMGAIPPPPPSVQEYPQYEIWYVSKLAMAVKALEIDSTREAIATMMPLMQIDPGALDVFDTDEIARGVSQVDGVPARYLRSPDKVAEIRQQRQAMQQAQQLAEIANKAGGAVGKAAPALAPQKTGAK